MPQPRPLGGSECEEKRHYYPAEVCGAPSCQLCLGTMLASLPAPIPMRMTGRLQRAGVVSDRP